MLLRTALAASVAFHASLLLIGDTQPNSRVRDVADRGIDVVLVNAKSYGRICTRMIGIRISIPIQNIVIVRIPIG